MNKIIISVVIVAICIFGGYFIFNNIYQSSLSNEELQETATESTLEQANDNTISEPATGQATTPTNNVITYTDSGYSPSTLTIKVGETVIFKNESSKGMWTASGMHPTHIVYSGTSLDEHCPDTENTTFDECTSALPGEFWSFTFQQKGTWTYHNHVKAQDFGKIIVE